MLSKLKTLCHLVFAPFGGRESSVSSTAVDASRTGTTYNGLYKMISA